MPLHLVATDRPIRPAPAGCDQQGRVETRTHRVVQWADTVAVGPGSADPLGDDQAERHSAWGDLPECAPEGGQHREPSGTVRRSAWAPVVSVAALAACYLWEEHRGLLTAAAAVAAAATLVICWPLN